jgi:ribosomal protein L11 methyltransferase
MAVHGVVDVFDADHDGWLDAWRPFARAVHVGRVVVQPPWETVDAVDLHLLVVSIDPGRAFGQGNHPTTRLMLAMLQDLDLGGARVLDVGCGSGVLAVTSVLLGAEQAVGIDIEDEAVRVTVENAERNGVSERVEASTRAVGDLTGVFDVVLANILAPVLIDLAPAIRARVAPGGGVVLSGFREDQRDAVVAAYAPLALGDETFAAEWRAVSFRDI